MVNPPQCSQQNSECRLKFTCLNLHSWCLTPNFIDEHHGLLFFFPRFLDLFFQRKKLQRQVCLQVGLPAGSAPGLMATLQSLIRNQGRCVVYGANIGGGLTNINKHQQTSPSTWFCWVEKKSWCHPRNVWLFVGFRHHGADTDRDSTEISQRFHVEFPKFQQSNRVESPLCVSKLRSESKFSRRLGILGRFPMFVASTQRYFKTFHYISWDFSWCFMIFH